MQKRMKRYLSLALSLCMLVMAMPPIGLAEDATAPVATANSAAALEPTAGSEAAAAALVTPGPLSSPEVGVTADATPEPNAASTVEPVTDPERSSEPDASAAPTAGDGPEASVAAEATPEPIAEPDATPEPDATAAPSVEPEVSIVPTVEPTSVDSEPTPVCIDELPPLEEESSVELAMEEASVPVITNTCGVLSYTYTVPDGVSVSATQWLKGKTAIVGAIDPTYTLTMEDMRSPSNNLYVQLTLSDGTNVTTVTSSAYSMSQNQVWSMGDDGVLIISGNYDGSSTNFPISGTIASLTIASSAVVSNASFTVSTFVSCTGTLNNCALNASNATVSITGTGKVSGGSISCNKLNLLGSAEDCTIVAQDVAVSSGASLSGGSVTASALSVGGTIDSASLEISGSINFSGSGQIRFNVKIITDDYSGTAEVTMTDGALLVAQLNAIMAAKGYTGSYTWFRGETAPGTPIAADEKLSTSMQGQTFTGALLPVLRIQRSGSELSATGATSVKTLDTLTVVAENCVPTSYSWYAYYDDSYDMPLGSGGSLTVPTTVATPLGTLPVVLYYGNVYCVATYDDGQTVYSPRYPIEILPDEELSVTLSSSGGEGACAVGDVLSFNESDIKSYADRYGLKVGGYAWGDDTSLAIPTEGAAATYTLGAQDLSESENTIRGAVYLYNGAVNRYKKYVASFTIPAISANSEWKLEDGTLTFIGNYNQSTTKFPIDGLTYTAVVVSSGVTVNGAKLTCNSLNNSGVIYDTEITCSGNITNSGEIHVPVTIDDVAYSSTPNSPVKFLYGAYASGTLNAWYKEKYRIDGGVLCLWCDANGKEIDDNLTLGLSGNVFSLPKITLNNDAPMVGDTVTVTATASLGAPEDVTWKWYYVLEEGGRVPIYQQYVQSNGAETSSCRIVPDHWNAYAGSRLMVEVTDENGHIVFCSAITKNTIPRAEIIVSRKIGEKTEELAKRADGDYIAYAGDSLIAEVKNVSETFLNKLGEAEKKWSWDSYNKNLSTTASLELTDAICSADSYCRVYLRLGSGNEGIYLSRWVYFYIAAAPDVKIDYEKEALYAVKPANDALEGLRVGGVSTDAPDSGTNRYTIPIASIDDEWPDGVEHDVTAVWFGEVNPSTSSAPTSAPANVTIPARPTVERPDIEYAAHAITVKNVSLLDYDMKLVASGADWTATEVASPTDSGSNVKFTGLSKNTEYVLWMRKKAVQDSSFASLWTSFDVETGSAITLTPYLGYTTWHPMGFSLDEAGVKELLSLRTTDGQDVSFKPEEVTLTMADVSAISIVNAGEYQLKISLTGTLADSYSLSNDKLTLRVNPYPVVTFNLDSNTYRGTAYAPNEFKVTIPYTPTGGNGISENVNVLLTESDYELTPDNNASLRNVSSYPAEIRFKGNYAVTDGLNTRVDLVITPRVLRATAAPAYEDGGREYDGSTTIACTANWDNCNPFAGDDVSLAASGAMKTKDVGDGKSVAITLALEGVDKGNYKLESSDMTGTVNIWARKLTVSPEWPANFEYTGETDVPLTKEGWSLGNVVTGDAVSLDLTNASASVEDPNAGENKAVSFAGLALAGADKGNYVIGSVEARSVTIDKADPTIDWPTVKGPITYGDSLADCDLSHTTDDHGSFAWREPGFVPKCAPKGEPDAYPMIYTPDETAKKNYNYSENDLIQTINVEVNKAAAIIDVSGVPTLYTYTGAEQTVTGATLNHSECELEYRNNKFTTVAEGNGRVVTITAKETDNYLAAEETVTIQVNKATAPVILWPTADSIKLGQSLGDSKLNSSDTHGSFDWEDPKVKPESLGQHSYPVIYTPKDALNYDYTNVALKQNVSLTVIPADAPTINWPTAGDITYGQSLEASVLSHIADDHGTFAWKDKDETPNAGTSNHIMVYTPSNTTDYNYGEGVTTVEKGIPVTVNKAEPKFQLPKASEITYGQKLSESTLTSGDNAPGSFTWENGTIMPPAGLNTYNVVLEPDDLNNYNWTQDKLVQRIEITVKQRPANLTVENAAKLYGDADPAVKLSITNVLKGDSLNYTISRVAGENVGRYAYTVKEGSNPNYTLNLLLGELTIQPRSIADDRVSVSAVGEQMYTGLEIRPEPTLTFDGAALVSGRDYALSYSNNTDPGSATITITGQGNFCGSREVNFTINPKPDTTPTATATATPTATATATPTATATATPTATATATPTATATATPTATATATPTATATATPTATATATPTATATATPTATATATPTATATATPTATATATPTATATATPTATATATPTATATAMPTATATATPTATPTATATATPAATATATPTATVKPTATPTVQPTAAPSFAPIQNEALLEYLNGLSRLVFDAEYEAVGYAKIPLLVSDAETEERILLIGASQDEIDAPAQRSLMIDAAQLKRIEQLMQEDGDGEQTSELLFENCGAAVRINLEEMTGGSMAKLMALILSGEEITDELLQSDWSAMEDAALTEAEYARFKLEVRIAPVRSEDGRQGYEISVWLCCGEEKLNVSDLLETLRVTLDVNHLVTEENVDAFEGLYAIAREFEEEIELLDGVLAFAPTIPTELIPAEFDDMAESDTPTVVGHYVLSAPYAGESMHWISEIESR